MGGILRNSPEFNLITRYFSHHAADQRCDLSIGDDAAVFTVPEGQSLVFSIDTLVEGRHFPKNFPARYIAQRALGSALSDLAAMGAKPSHFTLALTMPEFHEAWLKEFSEGLFLLADKYDLALVGGDTTKGALTISVQVHGLLPQGAYVSRSKAVAGNGIYVSGTLGDAAAGLQLALSGAQAINLSEESAFLYKRFASPQPRIDLGMCLRGKAGAMIDVSDGLLADLDQLMVASNTQCCINLEALPISSALRAFRDESFAINSALTAGDDYELLAVIPDQYAEFALAQGMTRIGDVHAHDSESLDGDRSGQGELVNLFKCGERVELPRAKGFDHFA